MISQCPNCKTRFVVSEAQLAAAQGNVRCGACMKVFCAAKPTNDKPVSNKAIDNNRNQTNVIATPQPTADAPQTSPASDDNTAQIDNISIEQSDTQAADENNATDNWLSQLLPEADNAETPKTNNVAAEPEAVPATDISALSKDLQSNHLESQRRNEEQAQAKQFQSDQLADSVFDGYDHEEKLYADTDGRIEPSLDSTSSFDALNRIDRQPVEISLVNDRPSVGRLVHKIVGSLICVSLLGLLAMQWLLNNPEDFQYHPRWQAAYQIACQLRQCTPASSATDYQTLSLLVRDHPSRDNALSVETMILNSSKQPLPFPLIEMHFTDLAGNTSAYRQFTAEEYLHGELSGASTMAPATPIQVALAIKDPGAAAVNYTIKLLAP